MRPDGTAREQTGPQEPQQPPRAYRGGGTTSMSHGWWLSSALGNGQTRRRGAGSSALPSLYGTPPHRSRMLLIPEIGERVQRRRPVWAHRRAGQLQGSKEEACCGGLPRGSAVCAPAGNYGTGTGSAALDSLKESGALEYAADVVLFLTEAQEQRATPPARAVERTVAKNRHGDTGKVGLIFRPDLGTMRPEQTTGPPR